MSRKESMGRQKGSRDSSLLLSSLGRQDRRGSRFLCVGGWVGGGLESEATIACDVSREFLYF